MNLPGNPITETDAERLAASWITPELAAQALLRRVTALDGAELVGRKTADCAGIVFPYIWPGEAAPREYRLRRDVPDVRMEGDKRKESNKYMSAPGRANMFYFFPGTPPAWLRDHELPIVITEGEKKAIALWRLAWDGLSESSESARFLPIGLSGVWNWRGTVGKESGPNGERVNVKGVIPDFSHVEWKERKVVLLFDANVKTNESVRAARTELARHLIHERGAHVFYADLPAKEGINGVDDLLSAVGPGKVLTIIEKAKEAKIKEKQSAQAAILGRLYEGAEFFRTADQKLYATVDVGDHKETWPLKSSAFKSWLARRFYIDEGKPPSKQALEDAIYMCESQALFDGQVREVGTRIIRDGPVLYVDLSDEKWRCVEITASGWRVTQDAPVRFRRSRGMMALPYPLEGGSVDELRQFVNAGDDDVWALLLAWLVGAFNPSGPYPLLVLQGEQGTAKSTTARVLRSLVDPSSSPLRSLPKEERDLMIAANNAWLIAFDNLSGAPQWISDALCRLATGGGFATRELHSDSDEILFDAQRPIILNGIDDIATNADLADRALIVTLPPIERKHRKPEADFWAHFELKRARIFGALLSAVSSGVRRAAETQLREYPRMADFARWVYACSAALPITGEEILDAYMENQRDTVAVSIEGSPVAAAIQAFMRERHTWTGTASELLECLAKSITDDIRRLRSWPKDPRAVANRLRRVAPVLRQAGVEVRFVRQGKDRLRIIEINRQTEQQARISVRHRPPSVSDTEDNSLRADANEKGHRPPSSAIVRPASAGELGGRKMGEADDSGRSPSSALNYEENQLVEVGRTMADANFRALAGNVKKKDEVEL
jgi:Domain of unknown function (DUF3854)